MRITGEPIARAVMGSKVKRRILAFLFSNQAQLSERELARMIGVSHVAVNKAMRQLEELKVVKGTSVGAAAVWRLDEDSFVFPYVKALIEASTITPLDHVRKVLKEGLGLVNELLALVGPAERTGLEALEKPPIRAAYIFGSVAQGTPRLESDIDVLVVLEDEAGKELMARILNRVIGTRLLEQTGNAVQFHIYGMNAVERNKPHWLRDAMKAGMRVV